MDVHKIATEMLSECVDAGQSARRVTSDTDAAILRQNLRAAAREQQLRIRTARMDDTVAVVRTDADLWHQDAATMRRKLSPPS